MTLRKFLLIPLAISLGFFVYFSEEVWQSFLSVTESVEITAGLVVIVLGAVLLQFVGHIVRAYKAKIIFGITKESSVRFQFRALSIGYLFNAVLPLKLGELVRARIISGAMSISFGWALTLIIFERAVDAVILGFVGFVVIYLCMGNDYAGLLGYTAVLLAVAGLIFAVIYLAMKQDRRLVRFWYKTTELLNSNLKTGFRFKAWSVMYGLNRTMRPNMILRYVGLSITSWGFYFASILLLVTYFDSLRTVGEKAVLTIAPYFGIAIPAGPANLGVFSDITEAFTSFAGLTGEQTLAYNLLTWSVLVLPVAFVGLALLLLKTKESLHQVRPKHASKASLANKLYRSEDISQEMANFLENFFSGNSLSRIVHKLELRDNFRLVKYFKGGSDAITILALQDGKEVVKKIIPIEFRDRLYAQYKWLEERKGRNGIVTVLAEEDSPDYYAIDLDYDPRNEMFYEYIHKNPVASSSAILGQVWEQLGKELYAKVDKETLHSEERQQYVDKHIFGCLDKAAVVDPELLRATESKRLKINGRSYHNLYQVMEKIRKHPEAWKDIGTYRQSALVHGDVIVDNLLVSTKTDKVLIIDPAPDGNIVNGPVFDFGKNMQSLYCGYEALLRDEDAVFLQDGHVINYRDNRSEKYTQLSDYVRTEIAPRYLTESEQRAMLFHAAALFIRRLKHQVYYTPENTLKFYAVGVKTLNEFLSQYEKR